MGGSPSQPGRSIAIRQVEIASDKARGETQSARSFYHQNGKVPTGAFPEFKCCGRTLSSWRRAAVIRESIRDRFIEGHQDLARRASRSAREKRVQPSAYIVFRVGNPSLNIRCQVRRFFVMIREWMVLRVIFNSEVRGVLGGVIELDDTLEPQVIAYTVKIDVRNAIPEDIMKPSHL